MNVHDQLATQVAEGLRIKKMPKPGEAAQPTRTDLEKSNALSIALNGPKNFRGRKIGVLVTDGVDAGLLSTLRQTIEKEGALLEIVAPAVGDVEASDGTWIEAKQNIAGGPSVLYDAVAILDSEKGVTLLLSEPVANDFVSDAFAHCKWIAYVETATPLLKKACEKLDEGCIVISSPNDVAKFIEKCRTLRFWARSGQ